MNTPRAARVTLTLLCAIALLLGASAILHAVAPSWWSARGVASSSHTSNDFAAANAGQLKNFAVAAYEEFLAKIPAELGGIGDLTPRNDNIPGDKGGTGWRLQQLVKTWVQLNPNGTVKRVDGLIVKQTTSAQDFSSVNQGQLKATALPFYDRLNEIYAAAGGYYPPWTDSPDDDANHAICNLGQVKAVFSFDLEVDRDHDGMSDFAEFLWNHEHPLAPPLDIGNVDSDGDGLPDGDEIAAGSDPSATDSDGDLASDGGDAFPVDPRRIADVPIARYTWKKVSEGYTTSVSGIALGDGAILAYWWDKDNTNWGYNVWNGGSTNAYTCPKETSVNGATWRLSPVGVSATGILAGNAERIAPAPGPGQPTVHGIFSSSLGGDPQISREHSSTVCHGITRGGVIYGASAKDLTLTWSMDPYTRFFYELNDLDVGPDIDWKGSYGFKFIGDDEFPIATAAFVEIPPDEDDGDRPDAIVLTYSRGTFDQNTISYSGGSAGGAWGEVEGAGTQSISITPSSIPVDGVPESPPLKPPTYSVWSGGNTFTPVFPEHRPDSSTSGQTITDAGEVIGTTSYVTVSLPSGSTGNTHLFVGTASPVESLQDVNPYPQQTAFTSALNSATTLTDLILGSNLEGPGMGSWTNRTFLFKSGTLWQLAPNATLASQVNDDLYLGANLSGAAAIGLPFGVKVHGSPNSDDHLVPVSAGTDPDLAAEIEINNTSSMDITVSLSIDGTDGEVAFDSESKTIAGYATGTFKAWGRKASSGEKKTKLKVVSGNLSDLIEITVFEGIEVTFSGTFTSPVDSRQERWRPSNGPDTPAEPFPFTAIQAEIFADIADVTSRISLTKDDQKQTVDGIPGSAVEMRPWAVAPGPNSPGPNAPRTTIDVIKAVTPSFTLNKDPMNAKKIGMLRGRFGHNHPPESETRGGEKVKEPCLSVSDDIWNHYFTMKLDNSGLETGFQYTKTDSPISVWTEILTAFANAPAGSNQSILSNWLRGKGLKDFANNTVRDQRRWANERFTLAKGTLTSQSAAAKAMFGAQTKNGAQKTSVKMELGRYNIWRLTGKITEGLLSSPK